MQFIFVALELMDLYFFFWFFKIEEYDKRGRDIHSRIRELQLHQSNKVSYL